ncbi:hypothetical protein FIBSPDRAFT_894011 [Athelia psychrophila]|uniref:Uncharacterized protein n=1 Tax=Athelia psychrophila TaxID=1759441 RepID=A0A166GF73_9AGAM|nr:hypothetical protein FIBSPDRAFT_894011 [Fibularhizoctonia sp. CBS 109695]
MTSIQCDYMCQSLYYNTARPLLFRSNLSLFFPLDPWQLPQARAEVAGQQAFLLYRAPPLDGTPFDINTEEDDTVCTRDVIVAVEYNGKQGDLGRFPTLHYASLTVLYKKWGFYYQLYEALTNILDTAQDPSPGFEPTLDDAKASEKALLGICDTQKSQLREIGKQTTLTRDAQILERKLQKKEKHNQRKAATKARGKALSPPPRTMGTHSGPPAMHSPHPTKSALVTNPPPVAASLDPINHLIGLPPLNDASSDPTFWDLLLGLPLEAAFTRSADDAHTQWVMEYRSDADLPTSVFMLGIFNWLRCGPHPLNWLTNVRDYYTGLHTPHKLFKLIDKRLGKRPVAAG